MHVAVAHQDELRVDSLRKERFCEGFVEFGHGRGDSLGDEVIWYNKHAWRRPVNSIEATKQSHAADPRRDGYAVAL